MSNARFSILQSRAVEDQRISNAQFRTLAALGMFGDKDGYCFPNLKTLGDILGKTKQAVSKDIQALAEFGYVEITPQSRKDGSRMGNLYRLIFDPPRQPEVDTHQQEVDTHQPQVDTRQLNAVDALTPHINDSINDSAEEAKPAANIFAVFEQELGPLTPMISESLQDLEQEHTAHWVIAALRETRRNGKTSLAYAEAILKRWKTEGYGSEFKPASKANGRGKPHAPDPTRDYEAERAAEQKAARARYERLKQEHERRLRETDGGSSGN